MSKNSKNSKEKDQEEVVLPNQILEAIEYAKKTGENDKWGTGALRFDMEHMRKAKNGRTFWVPTEIYVPSLKQWKPMRVMVVRLGTKSSIKSPEERLKEVQGDEAARVKLQFRDGDTYTIKQNNVDVEQRFGEAMLAFHYAWRIKTMHAVEAGGELEDIVIKKERYTVVQTHRKNKPKQDSKFQDNTPPKEPENIMVKEDKDDPCHKHNKAMVAFAAGDRIIRAEIEFASSGEGSSKRIAPDAEPKIPIYDASKRLAQHKPDVIGYEKATCDGETLTYDNIHKFILFDSKITGVIDFSSTTISSMGVSIPGKFTTMIVRQGKGQGRRDFSGALLQHLDADEDEAEGSAGNDTPAKSGAVKALNTAGDESDEESKGGAASSAPKMKAKQAPKAPAAGEDDDDDDKPPPPTKPTKTKAPPADDADEDEEDEKAPPAKPAARAKVPVDEESAPPAKKESRPVPPPSNRAEKEEAAPPARPKAARPSKPPTDDETSDSEGDAVRAPPRRTGRK